MDTYYEWKKAFWKNRLWAKPTNGKLYWPKKYRQQTNVEITKEFIQKTELKLNYKKRVFKVIQISRPSIYYQAKILKERCL